MAHDCPICKVSRRPVGRAEHTSEGWQVRRWLAQDPIISGLATKGDAMKALWALKHRWSSITVNFMRHADVKLDLTGL